MFGFSKLDVMFGHAKAHATRMPYTNFAKPGVRLVQQTVVKIDPAAKRVTTDTETHAADHLVVASAADYNWEATPGLADVHEFYTVAGAERLRDELANFKRGHALVGVCGAPFKCPPAPSECALMLHDYLEVGVLGVSCEISFVLPLSTPVPPSPETSKALVAAFAERNIKFHPSPGGHDRCCTQNGLPRRQFGDARSICSWECPSIVYPPWFWIVASRKMVG